MPSTYTGLHYHLIFATKNREPRIASDWIERFHEYLGGTVRGLGGMPQAIGGVAGHVHLLLALKPSHCLSDLVRDLKKSSTAWVRTVIGQSEFRWQEGYCALTVSASMRDVVRRYINNQTEHHRVRGFREELLAILEKAEVEFDERYLD